MYFICTFIPHYFARNKYDENSLPIFFHLFRLLSVVYITLIFYSSLDNKTRSNSYTKQSTGKLEISGFHLLLSCTMVLILFKAKENNARSSFELHFFVPCTLFTTVSTKKSDFVSLKSEKCYVFA